MCSSVLTWQVGGYKIVFQADAPDSRRIPPHDLLGVTVILLSCFYKEKEFIRVRQTDSLWGCAEGGGGMGRFVVG